MLHNTNHDPTHKDYMVLAKDSAFVSQAYNKIHMLLVRGDNKWCLFRCQSHWQSSNALVFWFLY